MVYLDSNIVIYVIENHPTFGPPSRARIRTLLSSNTLLFVSDLTRLECRSHPLSRQEFSILRRYDRFFGHVVNQVVTLSTAVCDLATEIKALYGFRTVDSLHLACAVVAGCNTFLTNDLTLRNYTALNVESIP